MFEKFFNIVNNEKLLYITLFGIKFKFHKEKMLLARIKKLEEENEYLMNKMENLFYELKDSRT